MDYIDVAERIREFREKYPAGSLRPADLSIPYRIEKIDDLTYIVVVAAAYRGPDDALPGVGMAYEAFPGRTPYTKGSELQNAETSAWGRAIVATLAADTKRGIASAEEVRNRRAEQDSGPVERQEARSALREAQRTGGQQIPQQGHTSRPGDPGAALLLAKAASQTADRNRLLGILSQGKTQSILDVDVSEAICPEEAEAAGVTDPPVTLEAWVTACGKHAKTSDGRSVRQAAFPETALNGATR